jgi:hypothetical protein
MQTQGYTTPKIVVYESLVRASVILYLEAKGRPAREVEDQIREEQGRGFVWMKELCALMRQYTGGRDHYASLNEFMPVVAQFFNTLGPRMPEIMAHFVHVSTIQPAVNHAADVDSGIQEIVVVFDKTMDVTLGYSIYYGEGGKDHFPISGKPSWLADNRSLRLPVTLKPHQSYSFTLYPQRFASTDGFALAAPYSVSFQTK